MKWNDIIRSLRSKHNYTLKELASKINVDPKTLTRYERAQNEPTVSVLLKLSEIFDVSIDFLCGKKELDIDREIVLRKELEQIAAKIEEVVKSL